MTGTLTQLTGNKRSATWDTENASTFAEPKALFDSVIAEKGVVIGADGARLTEFDPSVTEQTAVSAHAGG